VGVRFLNRSPCDGRSWKVSELGRGVVPTFWGNDMDVVTAYLGKLPGFRKSFTRHITRKRIFCFFYFIVQGLIREISSGVFISFF